MITTLEEIKTTLEEIKTITENKLIELKDKLVDKDVSDFQYTNLLTNIQVTIDLYTRLNKEISNTPINSVGE